MLSRQFRRVPCLITLTKPSIPFTYFQRFSLTSLICLLFSPFLTEAALGAQPDPGWYNNSATVNTPPTIEVDRTTGLNVMWGNSYIYHHPGPDNLYWYAQIVYLNDGNNPVAVICNGRTDPSLAKEWMRGTQGIPATGAAYVSADETFCSRNPNFAELLQPKATHYEWAIFHNVPSGAGTEVSVEWDDPQSASPATSPWFDPWHFAYRSDPLPPAECPPELVNLGTCQPAQVPTVSTPFVCLGGCNTPQHSVQNLTSRTQAEIKAFQDIAFCAGSVTSITGKGLQLVGKLEGRLGTSFEAANNTAKGIAYFKTASGPEWWAGWLAFGKTVGGLVVPFSCFDLLGEPQALQNLASDEIQILQMWLSWIYQAGTQTLCDDRQMYGLGDLVDNVCTTGGGAGGGGGGASPSNISVFMASGGAGIGVSWSDNSNNEQGFDIGYSPTQDITSAKHELVQQNQTFITSDWGLAYTSDGLLVAGQTMCFQVSAYNATGSSAPTPWSCITVP